MQREAYENLANAIIIRAVKDYKIMLNRYRKNPCHYTYNQLKAYEDFFMSDYCNLLTKLDTKKLIYDIRRSIWQTK